MVCNYFQITSIFRQYIVTWRISLVSMMCFFTVELSEKELNNLYKIVDNFCLAMAKNDRYIDTLKDYDETYLSDFGLNNIYLLNSFYILTSARFCNFLLKSEATDGFCQPFSINKDYKVLFSYN